MNTDIEPLVQEHLSRLLSNLGCFVLVPVPLQKKGLVTDELLLFKREVCDRTVEMLKIMGIEYTKHDTNMMIDKKG